MNLEALLTYFGLLAAALAIMGPVQRRALALFVPRWLLPISTVAALAFLILRDTPLGIPPPFGWRLDLVTYLLTLGAFVLPMSAAFIAYLLWFDGKLSSRNLPQLEAFLQTALREDEFDEGGSCSTQESRSAGAHTFWGSDSSLQSAAGTSDGKFPLVHSPRIASSAPVSGVT